MHRSLALLVALAACGDSSSPAQPDGPITTGDAPSAEPRDVTIRFAPQVNAEPFACGHTYAAMGAEATAITPRDFRFYVHDVELLRTDGERVPLALAQDGAWQYQDVALLDFEDFTGGCADGTPETNMTLRGTVPAGAYTGIAFTIGVPEAMNHVDLTSLPAPLNFTSLWWGWGLGHVFLAVVTHAEITTPQPGTNDHYVHVGSTGCTGDPEAGDPVTCTHPNRPRIELRGFDPTARAIVADYGAVIAKSALASSAGCHSFSEDTCGWPFDYVGLNFFTGSQTPSTQTLFRIAP